MSVTFDQYLVSCRSLSEYRDMFALTDLDLARGPVLDCPGGGASFAAEACALGARVTAVDTAYSWPAERLLRCVDEGVEKGCRYVDENPGRFTWKYFADPAHHHAERRRARGLFGRDYAGTALPGRYLPAELPMLPFSSGAFRLALCSHLLFTYSDRLPLGFHVAAARELVRVTRDEVRIFPLLDHKARPCEFLKDLRDTLRGDGIHSAVITVPYEFQLGGNEMLVLSRAPID